jgi:hypothetical protein
VGARYYRSKQIREILENYYRSDLTQRAFAVREGVRYSTLKTWLMHIRYKVKENLNFTEVTLSKPRNRNKLKEIGLEIVLTNGAILRGGKSEQLTMLLKAIG